MKQKLSLKEGMNRILELSNEYQFSNGHQQRIEDRTSNLLKTDKELRELGLESSRLEGKARAFEYLAQAVEDYYGGRLISGIHLFTTMLKYQVFQRGLDTEQNKQNLLSILQSVTTGKDNKNARLNFEKGVSILIGLADPFLRNMEKESAISVNAKLEVMEEIIKTGQVRAVNKGRK